LRDFRFYHLSPELLLDEKDAEPPKDNNERWERGKEKASSVPMYGGQMRLHCFVLLSGEAYFTLATMALKASG